MTIWGQGKNPPWPGLPIVLILRLHVTKTRSDSLLETRCMLAIAITHHTRQDLHNAKIFWPSKWVTQIETVVISVVLPHFPLASQSGHDKGRKSISSHGFCCGEWLWIHFHTRNCTHAHQDTPEYPVRLRWRSHCLLVRLQTSGGGGWRRIFPSSLRWVRLSRGETVNGSPVDMRTDYWSHSPQPPVGFIEYIMWRVALLSQFNGASSHWISYINGTLSPDVFKVVHVKTAIFYIYTNPV